MDSWTHKLSSVREDGLVYTFHPNVIQTQVNSSIWVNGNLLTKFSRIIKYKYPSTNTFASIDTVVHVRSNVLYPSFTHSLIVRKVAIKHSTFIKVIALTILFDSSNVQWHFLSSHFPFTRCLSRSS